MKRLALCMLVLAATALAGCGATDFTEPDDSLKAQEQARATRGALSPTELPPGLGPDLPLPAQPTTAPSRSNNR
jgi:hypothetical protein